MVEESFCLKRFPSKMFEQKCSFKTKMSEQKSWFETKMLGHNYCFQPKMSEHKFLFQSKCLNKIVASNLKSTYVGMRGCDEEKIKFSLLRFPRPHTPASQRRKIDEEFSSFGAKRSKEKFKFSLLPCVHVQADWTMLSLLHLHTQTWTEIFRIHMDEAKLNWFWIATAFSNFLPVFSLLRKQRKIEKFFIATSLVSPQPFLSEINIYIYVCFKAISSSWRSAITKRLYFDSSWLHRSIDFEVYIWSTEIAA